MCYVSIRSDQTNQPEIKHATRQFSARNFFRSLFFSLHREEEIVFVSKGTKEGLERIARRRRRRREKKVRSFTLTGGISELARARK